MPNRPSAAIEIRFNDELIQLLAAALAPLLQNQAAVLQKENTTPAQQDNDLISRDDVCKILHFNKTTLHKHTKSGRLQSYAIGNRVLYKRSEVLEALTPLKRK